MAKELFFQQGEYKEAVDYFRQKINMPAKNWTDLEGSMHTRAFVIAGCMREDILIDFRKAVDAAIADGESLEEFRGRFHEIAAKWRTSDAKFDEKMNKSGYASWRSKVIYQTNMLTAAAAAQERQARAMPDVFTHAKYVCMMLPGSREEHKHWNGTVLPVNDPWWEKHSPPNGFGCLCEKEFISKYEMDRGDEKVTRAPTAANDTRNIGENWDYSIGDADAENQRLKEYTKEKEEKLFRDYPEARKLASEANAKAENQDTTVEPELDLGKIKTVKAKPLTKKELQAERIEREKNFDDIIQEARKDGIEYIEAKPLKKPLSEQQIIEKLGAVDHKGGACSSQALAYIANKFGLDVTDYRGGDSLDLFGRDDILEKFVKNGGFAISNYNGFKNAEYLLKYVEPGKEYYFTCGKHSAIIRKKGKKFEFLELQDEKENNGFKPLTNDDITIRFITRKNKTVKGIPVKYNDFLIDIEKLKDSPKFRELLGFFNTKA